MSVLPPAVIAQDIEVPNEPYTNSLTLDEGEWAQGFSFPSNPSGEIDVSETPALAANFVGTTNNTYFPPDTMGAVGTNRLVIMINGEFRIQDRAGNLIFTTNLNGFWSSSGTGNFDDSGDHHVFDPHVTYDPYNDRWIAVAVANPKSTNYFGRFLIGVSATGDPSGTWYKYAYNVDGTAQYWADYPQFGFNKDKVVVNFRYASVSSGLLDTTRSALYVFDKNSLYAGAVPPVVDGENLLASTYGLHLQPAFTYDTNIDALYVAQSASPNSSGQGLLRLYSITGAATNYSINTIGTVEAPPWVGMFPADTAAQKGTAVRINTGDDRMHQAVYRNGSIWCAHTICLPTGTPTRSAVQFWQIRTNAAMIQQGIIQDSTGLTNYAFPSIAVNRFGDAMIGCASLSTNMYASASYTVRSPLDQPGNFENVVLLKAGLTNYWRTDPSSRNRWGDYSATQVDPVNDTDFWTLQEYANSFSGSFTSASGRWGLWWGNVSLPNPGNDAFTNADAISGVQGSTNGTTLRATRETGETSHAGVANSPSVWYNWTAPSNGAVKLDLSANKFPLILAVYTGSSVGSLTPVTNSTAMPPTAMFSAVSNTTYRIAVAGNNGAQTLFTLDWVQPSAPMFLQTPQTTNVIVGETIPLTSLAIGAPDPAYQWRKEGTNVPSATNATLTITNIQFSDGTNYVVVATNIAGSVTSAVASIFIWPDSSARLLSAQLITGTQFTFAVAGLTNRPYRIETSTNLNSPTNWVTIYTNYVTYLFTNANLTNDAQRFFRAITNN